MTYDTLEKLIAKLNRLAKEIDPANTKVAVIDEKRREQKEPPRGHALVDVERCGDTIMLIFRS